MTVSSIVLVPNEAHRGLLAEGAPVYAVAGHHNGKSGTYLPDRIRRGWGYMAHWSGEVDGWVMLRIRPGDCGLRLANAGQVHPDGQDRLRRAAWRHGDDHRDTKAWNAAGALGNPVLRFSGLLTIIRNGWLSWAGTVVLYDQYGRVHRCPWCRGTGRTR